MGRLRQRKGLLAGLCCVAVLSAWPIGKLICRKISTPGPQFGQSRAPSPSQPSLPAIYTHDFGPVKERVRLIHTFTVQNRGSVTWNIQRIESSCACTAAAAAKRPVKPGEEFRIRVGYRSPPGEGPNRQKVVVDFQNPEAPMLIFEVLAIRVRDFAASTERIAVDPVVRGKRYKRPIDVFNNTADIWSGISAAADVPWLHLTTENVSPDATRPWCKQQWLIWAAIDSKKLGLGKHNGTVSIRPGLGARTENKSLTVAVDASVAPGLQVIPSQFFLGDSRPTKSATFRYSCSSHHHRIRPTGPA